MRDKDTILDLLTDTYKKYAEHGDSEKNIEYITNMLLIEVLCDMRDLLFDIRESGKIVYRSPRPLH